MKMLKEKLQKMLDLYVEIKEEVQRKDPDLYERWKAGGFLVDSSIVSYYPDIDSVVESIKEEEEE
jgi:uncharacterized membrane protein